nr:MAG TPA: hypothetical protein [Caudoviricetes sp.]
MRGIIRLRNTEILFPSSRVMNAQRDCEGS